MLAEALFSVRTARWAFNNRNYDLKSLWLLALSNPDSVKRLESDESWRIYHTDLI
tara:strand:+ start:857 stop:1021 length:165 start_codon:yes stop_codon:yes gene_type:complete